MLSCGMSEKRNLQRWGRAGRWLRAARVPIQSRRHPITPPAPGRATSVARVPASWRLCVHRRLGSAPCPARRERPQQDLHRRLRRARRQGDGHSSCDRMMSATIVSARHRRGASVETWLRAQGVERITAGLPVRLCVGLHSRCPRATVVLPDVADTTILDSFQQEPAYLRT